jgi:hypothetical protein
MGRERDEPDAGGDERDVGRDVVVGRWNPTKEQGAGLVIGFDLAPEDLGEDEQHDQRKRVRDHRGQRFADEQLGLEPRELACVRHLLTVLRAHQRQKGVFEIGLIHP